MEELQFELIKPKYPVIDMHAHFGPILLGNDYENAFDTRIISDQLRQAGICKIVALDLVWDKEYDRLQRKLEASEGLIIPFGSVDVSNAMQADFEKTTYRTLVSLKAKGCKGIKLWKDMTLYSERYYGKALRLDDKRFSPIWQICAQEKLPIVIHIADPPALFKPIDKDNDYFICLTKHPEWSWYRPGVFSFEEHMEMQENILKNNPETVFIIAHVGSYAENLDQVGKWLDSFSNMFIDVSARIDQLGRQPNIAKGFIEKYQNRIMFGTDYEPTLNTQDFYNKHYRFFQTRDENFEHPFMETLGQWCICGIDLEDKVLEKIYFKNAERVLAL